MESVLLSQKAIDQLIINEEKYKIIAEASVDGIFGTDENNILNFVSSSGAIMFGYTVEELLGQSFLIFVPENARKKAADVICKLNNRETVEGNFLFQHKNGDSMPVYFKVFPFLLNNEYRGTFGVVRDLGTIKENEIELIKVSNKLRDVEEKNCRYCETIDVYKKKYGDLVI